MLDFNIIQSQNPMRLWLQPLAYECSKDQADKLLNIAKDTPVRLIPGTHPESPEIFYLRCGNDHFSVRLVDTPDLTLLCERLTLQFVQFSKVINTTVTKSQVEPTPSKDDTLQDSPLNRSPLNESGLAQAPQKHDAAAFSATTTTLGEALGGEPQLNKHAEHDKPIESGEFNPGWTGTDELNFEWSGAGAFEAGATGMGEPATRDFGFNGDPAATAVLNANSANAYAKAQANSNVEAVSFEQAYQTLLKAPSLELPESKRRALECLLIEVELNFFKCGVIADSWNIVPELPDAKRKNQNASQAFDAQRKYETLKEFKRVLDDCQLEAYGEKYCLYLSNRSLALQNLDVGKSANSKTEQAKLSSDGNYFLLGASGCIEVKFQKKKVRETILYRSVGKIRNNITLQQKLKSANVFVSKLSLTCDLNSQESDQVASVLQEQPNSARYFKVWRYYDAIEIFNQVQKIKERGLSKYNSCSVANDGAYEFSLSPASRLNVEVGDRVEISNAKPDYEKFSNIEQILASPSLVELSQSLIDKDSVSGSVIEISTWNNSMRVKIESNWGVPATGYISMSLRGFVVQFKRKMLALERIMHKDSNIAKLGDLFNVQDPEALLRFAHFEKIKHYEPLSLRVRNKVFAHEPTSNQLNAIKIALNTPDIALIQGPPGTGKTTVIQAIVERLNEIMRQEHKQGNLKAQILVSSFQHEAVDNVISKLNINSLPTFKFGGKRDDTNQRIERACEQWRSNISEQLHNAYGEQLQFNPHTLQVQNAIAQYECSPTKEHAKQLVQAIAQLPSHVFNDELNAALQAEIQRLSIHALDQNPWQIEQARRYVYALRTEPYSYADDGRLNLYLAWEHLQGLIDNPQLRERLHRLTCGVEKYPQPEYFFAELAAVQQELLTYLQPEPPQVIPQQHPATMELIRLVSERIEATAACYDVSPGDSQERQMLKIVAELMNTLDNNFEEVQNTLKSMNVVVSSTVQQSMNGELIRYITQDKEQMTYAYDTVIVDEAARSTPIDLLIPMVLASRRIILVGDHKQLPHIVDEMVEKQIKNLEDLEQTLASSQTPQSSQTALDPSQTPGGVQPQTQGGVQPQDAAQAQGSDVTQDPTKRQAKMPEKAAKQPQGNDNPLHNVVLNELTNISSEQMLKLSLFEFLFSCLKKLELVDNIQRTVTLNNQFRMHPQLGQLVSHEFYEDKLKSPLNATYFDHTLKGVEHCFARWYHVPHELGEEEQKNKSYIREFEAQLIVWQLIKWLRDPSSKGMSFGVVSFYREQVNIIRQLALKKNIFINDGEKLRLAEEFDDPTVIDRLRIDTVDAFQGKEFDVVLLSMVRSSDPQKLSQAHNNLKKYFKMKGSKFLQQMVQTKKTSAAHASLRADPRAKTNPSNPYAASAMASQSQATAAMQQNQALTPDQMPVNLESPAVINLFKAAQDIIEQENPSQDAAPPGSQQAALELKERSNRAAWSMPVTAKEQQRFFGHLMSTNRLCVALSRQRKLLCVFGDLDMIRHPIGEHAIPALAHFAKLCQQENQVIVVVDDGERNGNSPL